MTQIIYFNISLAMEGIRILRRKIYEDKNAPGNAQTHIKLFKKNYLHGIQGSRGKTKKGENRWISVASGVINGTGVYTMNHSYQRRLKKYLRPEEVTILSAWLRDYFKMGLKELEKKSRLVSQTTITPDQ